MLSENSGVHCQTVGELKGNVPTMNEQNYDEANLKESSNPLKWGSVGSCKEKISYLLYIAI